MSEYIKVRCIDNISKDLALLASKIILHNYYFVKKSLNSDVYFVFCENEKFLGIYPKSSFQTLNEWRDSQINKIFNE